MTTTPTSTPVDRRHIRPTGTRPPRRLALSTRLALSVALAVATVVSLLTWGAIRIAAGQVETNLRETARLTAVAVADNIEVRPGRSRPDAMLPLLRDFLNAAIDLESIAVFQMEGGSAVPIISTSAVDLFPPAPIVGAVAANDETWGTIGPDVVFVAVPVQDGDAIDGAVAVSVSLASVRTIQQDAGYFAAAGALIAIAVLTLVMHLVARRLLLVPLWNVQAVTARARAGDLSVRATVERDDELGELATGLNLMLAELEELHRSLSQRVDSATSALRLRNEQLERSYESIAHLQQAASRAQELAAVGQTVANVAHQIGTPLNLVSGHVQLLLQETTDPVLLRRLQIVQEQVEKVTATVRDLLERARPRREPRPTNLAVVLRRLGDAVRARLSAAGITLDVDTPPGLPDITADETQLELALVNLVTNAADAMPGGGRLALALTPVEHGVRLQVSDTGSGIAPDILPHVFEPWVTTKPAGHGTGLGLTITRDVVLSLNGTIGVESTPGAGTTFTIELPAAAAVIRP